MSNSQIEMSLPLHIDICPCKIIEKMLCKFKDCNPDKFEPYIYIGVMERKAMIN